MPSDQGKSAPCHCGGTCSRCRAGHADTPADGAARPPPSLDHGAPAGRLVFGDPSAEALDLDATSPVWGEHPEVGRLLDAARRGETSVGRQTDGPPGGGQAPPTQPAPRQNPGCSGCKACSSGIQFRVSIAALDASQVGTPYADMERHANTFLNSNQLRRQANLTAPTRTSSGPFKYSNPAGRGIPAGMFTAGHFLFFMDWDICETAQNPCVLRTSETITVTRDGQAPRTTTSRPITPSLGNSWTKAARQTPFGGCDKKLVWVDAPGDIAITGGSSPRGFTETVVQTNEILDGGTGRVVDTVTETFTIALDGSGTLTASP